MDIEKLKEEWRKKRSIICPYCGYIHDPSSLDPDVLLWLVTYHGEDPPQEFYCDSCEESFYVQERVERTYEEKKTLKEFDL